MNKNPNQFQKKYLAICSGLIEGDGVLENYLQKNDEAEKFASLEYDVLDNFKLDNKMFSLVDVSLKTGRYNQIRKHFSLINPEE